MKPVSPKNYELLFEPDLKTFKFSGKEKISLEVGKPTNVLVLNAAEIDVRGCHVPWKGKTLLGSVSTDEKKEELTIRFSEKISGKVELHMDFVGDHNSKLVGFYRGKYRDHGKEKSMATTQFEAADARRAFPCWDEPEAKATFDISILVDSRLNAISNMPVAAKKKIGKKTLYRFVRTPVMSTYLLYMGIGEFEWVDGKVGKTAIRVVTTKGKKHQGVLALDFTKKFLEYYNNYFGIPYPLPKLDMLAIPDFAAGAMENWGAITFRETDLLFDSKSSSTATKQRVAEVIAHELAHQWFGNLVTMKWWNDLWLNESFATFMATKAVAKLYPEWDFWDQFVSDSVNGALALDALKSSHPIEVEVKSPGQVREIFDEISYDKGASVLRMLEEFVGDESFRSGLKNYLTKHKYGNTVTNDLWDALGASSKKPVREMMRTWIGQVGYPLVEVSATDTRVVLSQKRFLLEKDGGAKGSWSIPISVRTQDRFFSRLMEKRQTEINIDTSEDWFKLNSGQKGLYRVKYDPASLRKLGGLIGGGTLDNLDRWGLQNDLFALCVAGEAGVMEYLDFVRGYSGDRDYLVSVDIAGSLYALYLIFFHENFSDRIKSFDREFFQSLFDRLGWDPRPGEKHTDVLLRGFVISALGRLGDEEINSEARRRFDAFLKKPESLSPDIRGPVYGLVAWNGGQPEFEKILGLYRKSELQEEKVRLLAALVCSQDEKLIKRGLDFSMSDEVRLQDMYVPIVKSSGNPHARKMLWPWLRQNWKEIARRFGNSGNPILNRIVECAGVVDDAGLELEIRKFFKKNPVPGTEMKIEQTLERVRIHSRLLDRARKEFAPQ